MTCSASFTIVAAGVACAPAPHETLAALPSTNRAASEPASRKAYFGDLHLHSSFSIDAYMGRGNVVTPQQAFQFARGMPISVYGQQLQRDWPLDFPAITDHAENIGIGSTIEHPDSALARSEAGRQLKPLIGLTAGWPLIYQTCERITRAPPPRD